MAIIAVDKVVGVGTVEKPRSSYPSLVELDKYKEIFNEVIKLFRDPKMLFNLLVSSRDSDGKWLDVYDGYLRNVPLSKIKKSYQSIPRPITIMQRASWYKQTSLALFGNLPILELLAFIIFLASEHVTREPVLNEKDSERFAIQDIFKALGIIMPLFSTTPDEDIEDDLISNLVDLLSKHVEHAAYSDLGTILLTRRDQAKDSLAPLARLLRLLKSLLEFHASKDPSLGEPLQNEKQDQAIFDMEGAYIGFLMRYFALMRREDKEDIILDYLLRFNTFTEQHYKRFILMLSKDDDETKTLGKLQHELGLRGKFLTDLRRIRNAISHGTFTIDIDNADILKSKITFTNEERRGTRSVIHKIVKPWAELADHLEKIYDIVMGLDRRVRDLLVGKKLLKDDVPFVDISSKDLFDQMVK